MTSTVLGLKMAIIIFSSEFASSEQKIKICHIEITQETVDKIFKKLKKAYHDISAQDAYLKPVLMKKLCTMHKFEGLNNAFIW